MEMRGSLHGLLQYDQPHGWWMRSTVDCGAAMIAGNA